MGAGPFSSDANSTKQTSTQQQVGASGGSGYGGINDVKKNSGGVFGGGSTGNVSINTKSSSKTGAGNINVVTYDPAAAIAAINANQALSTQSISYANIVAQDALTALRDLQGGKIVADAGGSANDINSALNGTPGTMTTNTTAIKGVSTVAILTGLGAVLAIIWYYQNLKT